MARCEKRMNVIYEGAAPNMRRSDNCSLCSNLVGGYPSSSCSKYGRPVSDDMVCDDFNYTTLIDTYQLNEHGNFDIKPKL